MKSIAVLALVSTLATAAGCASTAPSRSAREVSVLAEDLRASAANATLVPPGDEMEMQFEAPEKKERTAREPLADKVVPETIGKPSITAARRITVE